MNPDRRQDERRHMSEAHLDDNNDIVASSWFRWIMGGVTSFVVLALSILTTNVIANDKDNTKEHINIRKEIVAGDTAVRLEPIEQRMRLEEKVDKILILLGAHDEQE